MTNSKLQNPWLAERTLLTSLLILTVVPILSGCDSSQSEPQSAMRQMRRVVALLHTHLRMQGRKGFPESDHRATDGTVTCSWRLTVLDQAEEGFDLEQSWKSPVNQMGSERDAKWFAVTSRSDPSPFAQVFGLVGAGTAFTEYEFTKGRDLSDAEPDAILLIDAKNQLIRWQEPGDIHVNSLRYSHSAFRDLEPNYSDGFLIAFVDGAVWRIKKDVPKDVIEPFFTLEGAKSHDREVELAPYALDKVPPLPKVDGMYVFPETGK